MQVIGTATQFPPAEVRALKGLRTHVRAIIRDGTHAFVGSQSLRKLELDRRREVGVIIRNPSVVRQMLEVFETDWNASVPDEKKDEKKKEDRKEGKEEAKKEEKKAEKRDDRREEDREEGQIRRTTRKTTRKTAARWRGPHEAPATLYVPFIVPAAASPQSQPSTQECGEQARRNKLRRMGVGSVASARGRMVN